MFRPRGLRFIVPACGAFRCGLIGRRLGYLVCALPRVHSSNRFPFTSPRCDRCVAHWNTVRDVAGRLSRIPLRASSFYPRPRKGSGNCRHSSTHQLAEYAAGVALYDSGLWLLRLKVRGIFRLALSSTTHAKLSPPFDDPELRSRFIWESRIVALVWTTLAVLALLGARGAGWILFALVPCHAFQAMWLTTELTVCHTMELSWRELARCIPRHSSAGGCGI